MLDFPDADERASDIQRQFNAEIEIASRMFAVWLNRPLDGWLRRSELPGECLSIAWMLNTQACRQFRSVVELCRIGEAYNATIVARSLFETTLAVYFVLAPKFHIVVEQKHDRSQKRIPISGWRARVRKSGERKGALPRKLRALLYAGHCVLQGAEVAAAGDGESPVDPQMAKVAMSKIGTKWEFIQRNHPKTYSGLQIRSLADAAGQYFPLWYSRVYKDQSRRVHGGDAFSHVVENKHTGKPDPAWFSTDGDVQFTLYCGTTLFFSFANYLNTFVDLGHATDMLIEGFFDEMKIVYNDKPPA